MTKTLKCGYCEFVCTNKDNRVAGLRMADHLEKEHGCFEPKKHKTIVHGVMITYYGFRRKNGKITRLDPGVEELMRQGHG